MLRVICAIVASVQTYCLASSRFSIVVAEQTTQACPPPHGTFVVTPCLLPHEQLVVETLMIALGMIVAQVLADHIIHGALTHHDHPRENFLFDGAHKSFNVGVEIGAMGR
jgi:hypothetical protein